MSREITDEQAHAITGEADRLRQWHHYRAVSHETDLLLRKQLIVVAHLGTMLDYDLPEWIVTTASQNTPRSTARVRQIAFTRDWRDPDSGAFTYAVIARKCAAMTGGILAVKEQATNPSIDLNDSPIGLLPGVETELSQLAVSSLLFRMRKLEPNDMATYRY